MRRRRPVGRLRCRASSRRFFALHLELFARRLVLIVPPGVGFAPPQRRRGVYVLSGACTYPVRTQDPTGVLLVDHDRRLDLRDFFAVWGQTLSSRSLAGFRGSVSAFVDGRRWSLAPGSIPLRRHAEIVLEIDGTLPPHPTYAFPPGL